MSRALLAVVCALILALALKPPEVVHTQRSELKAPARRVALIDIMLPTYIAASGGYSTLVGAAPYNVETAAHSIFGAVYPGVRNLPLIESSDPEELMVLAPEAIFISEGSVSFLRKIDMPGIVAVPFIQGKDTVRRIAQMRSAGIVANQVERSDRFIGKFREARETLIASLPRREHKLRILVLWSTPTGITIPGLNYYLNDRFELLGAENAGIRDKLWNANADIERLITLDPDVIILDGARGGEHVEGPASLFARPEMQVLRAVRERRVYRVPSESFTSEVFDDALMLRWMAELFYPKEMGRQLRAEMRRTYAEDFGYMLSDDQIDAALLWKENAGSGGYERFARAGVRE